MSKSRRKAMFTEQNVPTGGVCMSSFVVVKAGRKVLVGKMARPEIWVERFFVGERFAPNYHSSGKYLLPARHLAWYESPLEAAQSVLRDQLGLAVLPRGLRLLEVQSYVQGDTESSDTPPHWDICFVYEVRLPPRVAQSLQTPAWFRDLHFVPLASLSEKDFTRGHGDILATAGLIPGR